jgi:hypothetical protein
MDERLLKRQVRGQEKSYRQLSRLVALTLKYQGPETNELLDEDATGEIVRALEQSDL